MRKPRWLAMAAMWALAACASTGEGEGDEEFDLPAGRLELVVTNQRPSVVTAYIQWRGGNPTRLGEVDAADTRTFSAGMRGGEMRVVFAGATGSAPGNSSDSYVPVQAWDALEWIVLSDGSVFFQRLREE
ncbi:MAG: hypothetical protein WEB90_04155 [Gemmatimonadota bacterium]